jgi:hypothetical protein
MHAIDAPRDTPPRFPLRPHLARAALLVAVLGILPFVLDAHVLWQVLGPLVAVAILSRSVHLIWREVFSTDPRHLARG